MKFKLTLVNAALLASLALAPAQAATLRWAAPWADRLGICPQPDAASGGATQLACAVDRSGTGTA